MKKGISIVILIILVVIIAVLGIQTQPKVDKKTKAGVKETYNGKVID